MGNIGSVIASCLQDDAEGGTAAAAAAAPEQFRVVGRSGATVRGGENLDSPLLCTLSPGTLVTVDLVKGRRCRIVEPVKGWASTSTEKGYVIVERVDSARPRYRVVFSEGVVVRTAADPDNSEPVRLLPSGEIIEGTGEVVSVEGVERVRIDDGWVSVTKPPNADGTPGEALLHKLT